MFQAKAERGRKKIKARQNQASNYNMRMYAVCSWHVLNNKL